MEVVEISIEVYAIKRLRVGGYPAKSLGLTSYDAISTPQLEGSRIGLVVAIPVRCVGL